MRRLLLASAALMMLAIAFHLGSSTAMTCYVDHSALGIVALWHTQDYACHVLDEDGVTWEVLSSGIWNERQAYYPLPVPVSQIKYWGKTVLVTLDNEVWMKPDAEPTWVNCGSWPGSPSAVSHTSWSAIKAKYRE